MCKFKVCSLFAGIGGICSGFKQAGFDIVWANEFDKAACKTYRHNFGDGYLVEGDIREISSDLIPNFDVLVAGFPCQPFSIAGRQRGFNDSRGNLFFEIARIIDKKRPPVVFLENVQNFINHDDGKTFLVIYTTLAQLGYTVRYKVMAADEYGNLPQTRSRIFIIAFLDINICDVFKFPMPIRLTTKILDITKPSIKKHDIYYYTSGKTYESLKNKVTDKNSIYRMSDRGPARVANNMCPTLTANMGTVKDRVPVIKDDYGIRKLTIKECLEFQGFPDEFKFPNTITINDAYKQIGNSVCVPIVRKIATEIAKAMKKDM